MLFLALLNISLFCSQTPEKDSFTTFGQLPSLDIQVANEDILTDGSEMHKLACCVYHSLLKNLPALVSLKMSRNVHKKNVSKICKN